MLFFGLIEDLEYTSGSPEIATVGADGNVKGIYDFTYPDAPDVTPDKDIQITPWYGIYFSAPIFKGAP